MGTKQLGFGDHEQSRAQKRTKRERFLAQMKYLFTVGKRRQLPQSPVLRWTAMFSLLSDPLGRSDQLLCWGSRLGEG